MSLSRAGISLLDLQRSLARDTIGLSSAPPPDLVAVKSSLLSVLARVEKIKPVVQ